MATKSSYKKKRKKTEKKKKDLKSKMSKKGFKSLNCSPSSSLETKYTCYTSSSLNKLKDLWNLRHIDNQIDSSNPREIWSQLKQNMEDVCDSEKCWLTQKFADNNLDKDLKNYTFAPSSPKTWEKNPNEWLSSIDLTKVMKQYEKKFSNFGFLGPSPIDFDKKLHYGECVWNDLCNFDLKKQIIKSKNKFGVIFNTDTHDKDGSHWICIFIDLKKKYIYYFDSNNSKISKEVMTFIKRIQEQARLINIDLEYKKNTVQHQKTTTECGMYVLYVIIKLLLGEKNIEDFKQRISDAEVEKLRKVYFN